MIIRALDADRDLVRYLELLRQSEPSSTTAEDWRERQRRAGPDAFRRYLVGELAGEIVAAGFLLDHELMENGVAARVIVEAGHRGRGHGSEMAAELDALVVQRRPAAIEIRLSDEDAVSRAWAEHRGFRLQRHMVRSRLRLADFDAARHRPAVARAESDGFTFETTGDVDRLYEHPGLVRLIVREGPTWAGMAIQRAGGAGGAFNAFTGVLPAHRGRGLARALKVVAIEEAAGQGLSWIETANNVANAPMLAVNRRSATCRRAASCTSAARPERSGPDAVADRRAWARYAGLRSMGRAARHVSWGGKG
jgi:GNAT superfamily N-acetyltransferase